MTRRVQGGADVTERTGPGSRRMAIALACAVAALAALPGVSGAVSSPRARGAESAAPASGDAGGVLRKHARVAAAAASEPTFRAQAGPNDTAATALPITPLAASIQQRNDDAEEAGEPFSAGSGQTC